MNCYAGLAKRIVKSCFPQVVPVPQLEPLDASKISKQEVKDNNTNKVCFALSDAEERVFKPKHKPLTDEEAWEATLAWAEAKAKEREAARKPYEEIRLAITAEIEAGKAAKRAMTKAERQTATAKEAEKKTRAFWHEVFVMKQALNKARRIEEEDKDEDSCDTNEEEPCYVIDVASPINHSVLKIHCIR
jgi:hypothetical protein